MKVLDLKHTIFWGGVGSLVLSSGRVFVVAVQRGAVVKLSELEQIM